MKDYYRVLCVPRNATAVQIKRAYRKLLKACHPDISSSPQAADWTRQLNEAYAILSDPEAKASYDLNIGPEVSREGEPSARGATASRPTESEPPPRADHDRGTTSENYVNEPRQRGRTGLSVGPQLAGAVTFLSIFALVAWLADFLENDRANVNVTNAAAGKHENAKYLTDADVGLSHYSNAGLTKELAEVQALAEKGDAEAQYKLVLTCNDIRYIV